jgi:Ca2+-binding EF-hand superfamily protein
LFDIDRNGKLDQHEVAQVWMQYGKLRLSEISRLFKAWGPIRLQKYVNQEVRQRVEKFYQFLQTPYDGNYPGDPTWNTSITLDHLIVPNSTPSSNSIDSSNSSSDSSNGAATTTTASSLLPSSMITLTDHTNQIIARQFGQFDHDNDSVISQNDFERGAPSTQQFKINELFKHFDHDNDGQITREEFTNTFLSQAHWFLKKRSEVQQRQRHIVRRDVDLLLIKLKCRDAQEYSTVMAARKQRLPSVTQVNDDLLSLIKRVIGNGSDGHFFTGAYALSLTNEGESALERLRPPMDAIGQLDIVHERNTELQEIIDKAFKAFDTDGNGTINAGDFLPSLTPYQRQTKTEIFQLFDLDMNRNITRDEMSKAMKLHMQIDMCKDELINTLGNNYIVYKLKELNYFLTKVSGGVSSTHIRIPADQQEKFEQKLHQWKEKNGRDPDEQEKHKIFVKEIAIQGNPKDTHDKPSNKDKICHQYQQGKCKRGDNCKYKHVKGPDPKKPKNDAGICRQHQQGKCTYGDKCRFKHLK